MKKVFGLILMLMFVLVLPAYCAAEEFVIAGYGVGETAVKGDIEKQAKMMVESWHTKKPIRIIIQGFADKSGRTAENDNIARNRAREMEAFIYERIDANKITARSKGDSENARKVVVTVEFAAASASASAAQPVTPAMASYLTEAAKIFLISVIVAFAVVTPIVIWFWLKRRNKKSVATEAPIADGSKVDPYPKTTLSYMPVKITIKEVEYDFFPEVTADGRFKTFYEIKPGRFMFVGTEKELKKSLRTSFKKNPELVDKLIGGKRLQLA